MAPSTTGESVAKLWNLCNVLKDDGVTYHRYVSELTYLLFLKMAQETGQEQGIPEEWRWISLEALQGLKQLEHYKLMLLELGASGSGASPLVQEIYANASSFIKKPTTLNKLVSEIDKLDWYSARQEGLGDLYESNVHEPTLVIGRVGYYCGSVHLSPAKAWVTDNAPVVRHNVASTRQKYLYYALQAIDLRENDSSTAQPVISGSKIVPLRLIRPSVQEQAEIVDRLTPALLAKAFRGELVPQDPGDEPASALLARIRAARQAGAGAAKPLRRGRPKAADTPAQLHLDAAPVPSDSPPPDLLACLLREYGPLSERALLAASELRPETFRVQLAREQGLGAVRESSDDGQMLLEAVG